MLEKHFQFRKYLVYVKEFFFVYHLTGSTYPRIVFWTIYISSVYTKFLEGIGKIQFVSDLTVLLTLWVSKFHGSLQKEKKWNCQSLNNTPYAGKSA